MKKSSADKYLDAAREILAHEGPQGLTTRKLAERLNVSPMAIYKHYRNKEELVVAIVQSCYQLLEQRLNSVFDEGVHMARIGDLNRFLIEYHTFAMENPALYQLMFSKSIESHKDHPELIQQIYRTFAIGVTLLEVLREKKEVTCDDCYFEMTSIWMALHGYLSLKVQGRLNTLERYPSLNQYLSFITRSLISG